jgi:hypothetical protein
MSKVSDGIVRRIARREELFSNIHERFTEAGIQVTTEIQDVRVERKCFASRL